MNSTMMHGLTNLKFRLIFACLVLMYIVHLLYQFYQTSLNPVSSRRRHDFFYINVSACFVLALGTSCFRLRAASTSRRFGLRLRAKLVWTFFSRSMKGYVITSNRLTDEMRCLLTQDKGAYFTVMHIEFVFMWAAYTGKCNTCNRYVITL